MQNGSNGEKEKATGVVTLSLDPGRAIDDYAAARAQGPVVPVSFKDAGNESGADSAELDAFLTREHLFVSHYEEVLSALVDCRFSSDRRTAMTPEQREKLPPLIEDLRLLSESLLTKDPPDHTRLRKLIQPSFSPRIIEAMRPRIQRLADDLIDDAERAAEARGEHAPDRRMDLIAAFAYPLPVTVISDMLGIPMADRPQVKQWTENLLRADRRRAGGLDAETTAKLRHFTSYLRDLFVLKRKQPAEDMISQLLRAEEEGDKLNEDEVLSTVFILYLAGHVTTVNLIGNGVFALLQHPAELAKLKAQPSLAKGVVEETLRYWGPVDFVAARIAKENVDLGGASIPQGEPVMVGLAAANRDPARFPNPDTYDITREGAERHVAFGKGIHLCVGAPLARVEGQIAFDTLVRRLPAMRLAVPPEQVRWSKAFLRGLSELPVLF
ncbi:cytochrome P450 family protein [Polyangium jinanense]|uniref:Cytochrome P450 n=1 Tax=Polyangium jinanense TaxID=2829994 RepID=A0A9X3X9R0_9BACT|nr:cytochrome P450 [Polyangium jinanense]MDC3959873.1 cytochrome P450 [Polyangium jinanense]MDC3986324.1 cytochrome P450 [Polyangium jinanense]